MKFFIVYWYDQERHRQNGSHLVYARNKKAAHTAVRNAFAPPGVTAMVPSYADLLTPQLEEGFDITEAQKNLASQTGPTLLEYGT